MRALGQRGMLSRVKGILVGRLKAWAFDKQYNLEEKEDYRKDQKAAILSAMSKYNPDIPVVQNIDFGHTDPQIPMPYGGRVRIDCTTRKLIAQF